MEDIEFCKADFLYMLSELNEYAVMNDVRDVWINNYTRFKSIVFSHFNDSYEFGVNDIRISLGIDNIDTAYEKYKRMMKCMKEGALLAD